MSRQKNQELVEINAKKEPGGSGLVSFADVTAPKVEQAGPAGKGQFVYVDISSVDNKTKRITEPKTLDIDAAPSRAKQRLQTGDVLVSMTRPNLNAVAMVSPELDGSVGSTGFHVLRANEQTEPRWLYYAVQTHHFVSAMSELVQGALYPAVRPKDIRAFEIPHPPVDQQKRIVAEIEKQFTRLDEAVANLKRVKANLKRYKAAVLKAAVEGDLDFVGRVSQGASEWKTVRLADIGELISGQSPPSNTVNNEGIGTLYITGPEQWDGRKLHLVKWTTSPKKVVPDGCFFITVKGAGVGKVFPGTACAIGRDIYAFKPSELVSNQFVMHALIASVQDVLRHASGDIPGLSRSHILDHKILLPSREEQDRLVEELERRNSYATDLEFVTETSLQRAEHSRQSILAKMFGGGPVRRDSTEDKTIRRPSMEKRKLPGLPPARKSEAEDLRVDLELVLRNYPDGISAELLFQKAGYQGDQVDVFYRDLARLIDRMDQIQPEHAETEWPISGSVKVRFKA